MVPNCHRRLILAKKCSKCGCSELRRSVRRNWEWMLVGILLPYRCPSCDRRFLGLRGEVPDGPPELVPVRSPSAPSAVRQFFLFRKSRRATGYTPAEDTSRDPGTPEYSGGEHGATGFDTPHASDPAQEDSAWLTRSPRVQSRDYRFRVVTAKAAQRRRDKRLKSDPQAIHLQVRMGDPEWLPSTLLDASEGGIGISVSSPLTVGLTIAARGKFDESRNERVSFATVKWCAKTMNGNFQAGLEFGDHHGSADNDAQRPGAKTGEEFDYYEMLQLSPNAETGTIERVYRLLAQRYHPHKRGTGNLEMFLRLHEAYMVLSDPDLRDEYDAHHRESKSFPGKAADPTRIPPHPDTDSFPNPVPARKQRLSAERPY